MALDNLQDVKSQIISEVKSALASDVVKKAEQVIESKFSEFRQIAQEEAQAVFNELPAIKAQLLEKNSRADRWLDKGAIWIGKHVPFMGWLPTLFTRLSALEGGILVLVVLVLLILGGVWIKNKFQDNSYQTQNQAIEKAKTDKVAEGTSADTNAAQLKAEYDRAVTVAAEQQKQIDSLQGQLYAQQSKTAAAKTVYIVSKSQPVAAVELSGDDKADAKKLVDAIHARGIGQ